ncbi:diphthine synthase [Candidatus Woesearchaeota archaeon CG10_big_fil_rev_8_21_14_0_10_44_13]|nr:MAG: diphthine synthase [Candidatus Woesearchaeota archaeon CG10_big_fil_rev_8_21_14_0_10_44_13]
MALYIIGIGLSDEKDITVKGLEIVKKADFVYLENYTSILQCPISHLEKLYGKRIILTDRDMVEKRADEILEKAKTKDVAFLVVGDPMSATTHIDLMLRAKEKDIDVRVIHNASILTAVGITGLQLYKFGKTTSIPFPENVKAETPYNVIEMNRKNNMHTLVLLDIDVEKNKFMKVDEAIRILLGIEKNKKKDMITDETSMIGCARLGSDDQFIKAGKAKDLLEVDFGKPPHCLIMPAEMHFMEEEALKEFC